MKLQGLAVISIIIILPIAILLNSYSSNQIKTLDLQISYDSKLKSATYDGIKAFQLNMSNSSTSDLANSKMRDIKASIKTFYNSLSSNFNMPGYGEDVLKNYVPAIVYTLYDGYYIYSSYNNTLDDDVKSLLYENATYKSDENIYGLKPYVYYSCRYKRGSDFDVVITYTLDSYITIQGKIGTNEVNASGYLLSGVDKNGAGNYTYNGVEILEEENKEGLRQNVYVPDEAIIGSNRDIKLSYEVSPGVNQEVIAGSIQLLPYKKINGVKYYQKNNSSGINEIFAMINENKMLQNGVTTTITKNFNGIKYYRDAYDFKQKFNGSGELAKLKDLKTSDAVDINGQRYTGDNNPYSIERLVFGELDNTDYGKWIENSNSQFNTHKTEVIKNAIESNLMVAISNYNTVSTSDVNFAMPKLKDYEWEELTKNVSMITFLQGLSIGGKVYNGYSIVRNDLTEDYISENSIYIEYNGNYYRVTDSNLLATVEAGRWMDTIGLLNTDYERRTAIASYKNETQGIDLNKNIYYYPRGYNGSYNSIINLNGTYNKSISEYFNSVKDENSTSPMYKLAQAYYTALGRERYGMYRVNNKDEDVTKDLTTDGY